MNMHYDIKWILKKFFGNKGLKDQFCVEHILNLCFMGSLKETVPLRWIFRRARWRGMIQFCSFRWLHMFNTHLIKLSSGFSSTGMSDIVVGPIVTFQSYIKPLQGCQESWNFIFSKGLTVQFNEESNLRGLYINFSHTFKIIITIFELTIAMRIRLQVP